MTPPAFPRVTVVLPDPRLPDRTKVGGAFAREDLEAIDRLRAGLAELDGYAFEFWDDHGALLDRLRAAEPAFVLNLCDTGFRNEAAHELHVPALLELLGVPYSGSPPSCLGLCFDKANVRAVAADCGVPVPRQVALAPGEALGDRPAPLPAIVKPNQGDGGFGITAGSVVRDREALLARVAALRDELPGQVVLVQEFLTGEELGLGLLGNPGRDLRPLPVLRVDWSGLDESLPRILGYESKTLPDSPYWTKIRFRPAELPAAAEARLVARAMALFERLGCRDYARFDFRAGADGTPRLLEVNPNPAWCWDGKLNVMAGFAGASYPELLGWILEAAQGRVTAGPGGSARRTGG